MSVTKSHGARVSRTVLAAYTVLKTSATGQRITCTAAAPFTFSNDRIGRVVAYRGTLRVTNNLGAILRNSARDRFPKLFAFEAVPAICYDRRMPQLISATNTALVLAPMEGVTDAPMRALLTERGGFSFCVSEFLRVCNNDYPDFVYEQHVPELRNGCATPSGSPIQVQLLGGDERLMAKAAAQAVRLGARAIDINFGCPSKTVNRHDGGATLLQYPDRIRSIVAAVRGELDPEIPVSAKLRLGWEQPTDIFRNAREAEAGGASWITIHARTKRQGYAPPAYWSYIGEARLQVGVPVVANGDIWSLDDFKRCRDETGCRHYMIGRGALADPALPLKIARELGLHASEDSLEFSHRSIEWEPLLARFIELNLPVLRKGPEVVLGRIKQWLKFAHLRAPLAWFDDVKRTETIDDLFAVLRR